MSPLPTSLLLLLLACPALLTPEAATTLEPRGQRSARDTGEKDSIKVVVSEGCVTRGDAPVADQAGKQLELSPGAPLVLTHRITLVPSGSGAAACSGGCEAQFAALGARLERLEKEVSELREKCGGEGGCCNPQQSTGAGCSVRPEPPQCPNECSDQGRCVDSKCVCFPGFSGPDCSQSNCPGNCKDQGKCVNGQCVCDPGFTGPDCSQRTCPDNCKNHGRCINGKCICNTGFTGPDCSGQTCPDNCKNHGRCVNGKCVCNTGFSGPDCSEQTCLDNCKNRGQCVNGKCVCNPGFSGPDCSGQTCPDNCKNHGRCVNGKCVCNTGFSGPDCSEQTCLDNCKNRGQCVNGKCVCNPGFSGPDCSEQTCPDNCKNRGQCVNGKCVCNTGFSGPDCSEQTCPDNCKNRGQCVNGKCVCNTGFTGPDCSEQTCPDNCSDHGKCVDGKCVCDSGFVGPDCSDNTCSGNCRGGCVDGKCVCDPGFTGPDCTEKTCPDNCSNRGKCVDGKCVCDAGFTGVDCSAKGCLNNCNNKGRCVKGKCVCRRGFTGPDCSQCEAGLTGPECSTVMSGVSTLSTKDITETSATLFWTPPSIQYDTYHITFTSKKEGDQQITSQVEGRQSSFTQTGLAAGQEYTVTIRGEEGGKMGVETSTEFMTLISGPTNLQVVKTTTTSAVVQWQQSQGEIDRYRLTVSPNDGDGKERDMTLPADRDSAQIHQLEAGHLYDITLVAEKGRGKSKPATTQATPGVTKPRVTAETASMRVAAPPRRRHPEGAAGWDPRSVPDPTVDGRAERGSRREGSERGSLDSREALSSREQDLALTVPGRTTKPGGGASLPGPEEPATLPRSPGLIPGSFRLNRTRIRPAGGRVGSGPLKKPAGQTPSAGARARPRPLTGAEDHAQAAAADDRTPASATKTPGSDRGETGRPGGDAAQSPGGEPHAAADSPNGKACVDKIKVTHIQIGGEAQQGRVSGGRGAQVGGSPSTLHEESLAGRHTETNSLRPPGKSPAQGLGLSTAGRDTSSPETVREPADALESLLKETGLKIQTFSVHLTKPSHLRPDADPARGRSSSGESAPLHPPPSLSSSSSTSSSSPQSSSGLPSSYPSLPSSSSKTIPSSSSSSSYLSSELPSSSSSSSSSSLESYGPDDDTSREGERKTDVSPGGTKQNQTKTLREGGQPLFRRPTPKEGVLRRPRPNMGGTFQDRTRGYLRPPQHPQTDGRLGQRRFPERNSQLSRAAAVEDVSAPGDPGEPLDYVRVQNLSSRGFDLVWSAPKGKYENFVVTGEHLGGSDGGRTTTADPGTEGADRKFVKLLPGSARTFSFQNLFPQSQFTVTLLGRGPGLLSQTHKLVISTGPEPPSDLEFSRVTENSLSVSWTRPKSKVSGFKVTYTHTQDGEPVSVAMGSEDSTLALSQLSPGSSYEVSVISVLGLDESDPIKDFVMTLPDPPTDLRAVNVTDTKALLLWRPALAAIDKYVIVIGSEKGSDLRITVSGNAAEQQVKGLEGSTRYTVTITSQLGAAESTPATTAFTTTSGSEEGPRDLKASQVTPRSAVLSWKRPSAAVGSYKLTYQTAGQEMKEVMVEASMTEYKLTRLVPSSKYTVQLQGERGGRYSSAVSTEFTTGILRFPFPTDCSQELLNGVKESGEVEIFPQGREGPPLLVYCDMESDGGGWTVIQRRSTGKLDFFQGWKNYSRGFGNVSLEFWLGNENLHNLTKMAPMSLRVDLRSGGEAVFAKYSSFAVDIGRKNYKLTVAGYSGTAGDSMSYHNSRPFSTKDRDPMPFITRCAMSYRGGWWYRNCHEANLNGLYGSDINHQGIIWTAWKGKDFSIPFTEMKIRPTAFNSAA
ncbi:uncharacterized protein FYW47_003090 [Aplochiton taeniatus]